MPIPSPRSYSSIVSDMLDTLLSELGLPSVRVGSGTLSIIEAAAQSDLRSSQDIFNLLNSISLDRATGLALDRLGADEDSVRIAQFPASGFVTISDTSFTKKSTKIFQGRPAPIIGSPVVYVTDASTFPSAGGDIYIGRGTTNYEGPLTYTSKTNNTNYWTLSLADYTTKYHNLGETVVLSQGGDRVIPAGTSVQTAQANASSAVQFSTNFTATILDGETSVVGVAVTATTPGVTGNVIAGSINKFTSAPFAGATVTNEFPFSNGLGTEDDNTYRERLRAIRQSRSRGTALAIKTGLTGITSLDENKRVLSCSVVRRQNEPTVVYIDDGTGYEEYSQGIAIETLSDEALGGEQYFQLVHGRPVTKAHATTQFQAPFDLSSNNILAVKVGGITTEHSFSVSEFRSIANASAYEVAASINADQDLNFRARTASAGTKVVVLAKNDIEEDVEVVTPSGADANIALGFPAGRTDTLRLYKNDILLSKDGSPASVVGSAKGLWDPTSSGDTLEIKIDGVDIDVLPVNTFTINDIDFANAGTPYTVVSTNNSLDSWVQVLNYKIPGITASADEGGISLTSNRGHSSEASIVITGGTLVSKGLFPIASVFGKDRDYTLDRNLGQLKLENSQVLRPGDRLTAGSFSTRAFVQSEELALVILNGTANTTKSGEAGGELWFVVDGDAAVIPTHINPGTVVDCSLVTATAWGKRVRISHTPATITLFENAQPGDWIIVNDIGVDILNRGAWRIASVNSGGLSVDIEREASWTGPTASVSLVEGGISVVRTTAELQRVYLPNASNHTATSLAAAIALQLRGASAETYRTRQFRVRTNSFLIGGDIALVASNTEGRKLTLPIDSAIENQTSHLAVVESANSSAGTPQFRSDSLSSVTSDVVFNIGATGIDSGNLIVGLKALNDGALRYSNYGHVTTIETVSGTTITTRRPIEKSWLPSDRIYAASPYALTNVDELTVVLDGDTESKRFVVPMFRAVKPATNTYGITNDLKDKGNSDQSLAKAFGTDMDWRDFAVFMSARGKSHRIGGVDTNKTLLWRYKRLGSEGNTARVQYIYPTAPSQSILATWSNVASAYTDIAVRLPSGAARTGVTYNNSTRLGYFADGIDGDGLYGYNYIFNLPISTATREVRLNYTSSTGLWSVGQTVTGLLSGASGTIASINGAPNGYLVLTGVGGVFVDGEQLRTLATYRATASGSQYGYATATLSLPAGITNHGFVVGNVLHIEYNGTGTGAGFISGNRSIVAVAPSTISFVEGVTSIPPTASVGTVSFDTSEVKTTGSTVVVNDIMNVGAGTSLPAAYEQSFRVQTITDGLIYGRTPVNPLVLSSTISWQPINSTSNLSWFPIGTSTIVAISAAVNAQTNSPVTTFLAGDGLGDTSGSVTVATYEPTGSGGLGGANPWYSFSDGLNFIRSHTTPPLDTTDFTFTFKNTINSDLTSNSDWLNENIYLVPTTAENTSEYLSTGGAGGLFASGEIVVSGRGDKVQIATDTPGSYGSVQVQGGTANNISAVVRGQAKQVASNYMVVTVANSDTNGLSAGHWMALQNSVATIKPRNLLDLDSISTDGTVILTGTTAWEFSNTGGAPIAGLTWQVEKQGNFAAYQYVSGGSPDLSGVSEGDWVHIGYTGTVNTRNQDLFRIVRIDNTSKVFWVENSNVLEETATMTVAFLTYDSIVPGDKLTINTDTWGSSNLGTWTVAGIDLSTYSGGADNKWKFRLDVSSRGLQVVTSPGPTPAGNGQIQITERSPSKLFKKIHSISPNPSDSSLADIKFNSWTGGTKVNESSGTILYSLDKLNFTTNLTVGIDGYRHSLGLIEEANKVGYGMESDPSSYPGIIVAGANVNIEGPIIRRIAVSLGLRVRSGVNTTDIRTAVQSAVAAKINRTGVGAQIALSDIVSSAQSVNGVVAVTVLAPSFGPGTDLIAVQPFEKPMVLNLDDDIQIAFVGE